MDEATPPAPPQKQNADAQATAVPITHTALVWPGKYSPGGARREVPRVNLPFQAIETINESRATREATKIATPSLFEFYHGKEGDTFPDSWHEPAPRGPPFANCLDRMPSPARRSKCGVSICFGP
jgi:hypothetical protein